MRQIVADGDPFTGLGDHDITAESALARHERGHPSAAVNQPDGRIKSNKPGRLAAKCRATAAVVGGTTEN